MRVHVSMGSLSSVLTAQHQSLIGLKIPGNGGHLHANAQQLQRALEKAGENSTSSLTQMAASLAEFAPTTPPIDVAHFYAIAALCALLGCTFTALFFAYQAISTKNRLNARRDLTIALLASLSLGLGVVFVLLSSGVWL